MSLSRLFLVYLGALALLSITILVSLTGLPYRGSLIMTCALGEAVLILTYFVELKDNSPLVRLFALGTTFWLLLLFSGPMIDRMTR
ncbi:hypothetical protein ACI2KR_21060 [Pseudomonas luteola]